MRISELAEASGVSIATLKYYLREGLLHPGRTVSRTRADYDETHVDRVRLVRALIEVGGMSLAAVKRVVDVVSSPVDNSFAAQVLNVEYCGHDNIVDVEVAGGLKLIVRTTARLRVGDPVTLAIAPDKALAYPVDAAAGMAP